MLNNHFLCRKHVFYTLSLTTISLATHQVQAQQSIDQQKQAAIVKDAIVLEPVTFETEQFQDDTVTSSNFVIPENRTSGTKSTLTPQETPRSITVINNATLEERQVDSVKEALRYVPGVSTAVRSGTTIYDQYNIRGFDTFRNYYDGLPLQYNSSWNLLPQIDAFATERVEVIKGPVSSTFGSAPPGGLVNQTAKLPSSERHNLVRLRLGNSDFQEAAFDATGEMVSDLNYRLIGLARKRDGQAVTTKEERFTVAPSLTWNASDKTTIDASLYYQSDPEMVPSTPVPGVGTLYNAPYGKLAYSAFAGDDNWNEYNRETTLLGYKINHDFNDDINFFQNFRYTNANLIQKNTYGLGLTEDETTQLRSAYLTNEKNEGFVVDTRVSIDKEIFNSFHSFMFGIEYEDLDSNIHYGDTLGTDTPSIDFTNANYHQINPATLPIDYYQENHDIDQHQTGVYAQDEFLWNNFTTTAGLRWGDFESNDKNNSSFAGTATPNDVSQIDEDEWSFSAGSMYTFDKTVLKNLAPYFNYAESFEPTSGIDSITGNAFKPTTAEQIEFGVKYSMFDGKTTFSFAWFDLDKENVIVSSPDFITRTQNGEVESEGVELSLNSQITDKLDISANYTNMDVDVRKNPQNPALVGKTPVFVAERMSSAWVNYDITRKFNIGAGIRYTGDQPLDQLNTDEVPSTTIYDMVASYDINDVFNLGFSMDNITDRKYVSSCFDVNNCWYGDERRWEFTLAADF